MGNFTKSYHANVGLNHTPAYQVSGRPFATGSVDATTAEKIEFPFLTRWIQVLNHGNGDVKVGFSQNGVDNGYNYFRVAQPDNDATSAPTSARLELKVSELWISGSNSVDIVAGLTTVPVSRASGSTGPSFSGSSGVG